MTMDASYPSTWFHFGNQNRENARSNWIMKDLFRNSFLQWYVDKWHHLCISYDKKNNHIAVVKVLLYFFIYVKNNILYILSH